MISGGVVDNGARSKVYLSRPGVVTCAGVGLDALWDAVVNADTRHFIQVRSISGKVFTAGRVDDALLPAVGQVEGLPSAVLHNTHMLRMTEAALAQIDVAIKSVCSRYGKERVAVCVGSCDNGAAASFMAHTAFDSMGEFPADYTLEAQGASYPASYIAGRSGAAGVVLAFATACSSSATAIIRGAQLIAAGASDAVIAGGVDQASDVALLGFDSLEAVAAGVSNPFSEGRCGITLGDGAALFVLSRERIDGEGIRLLGWGESADAHHMTSPDASGEYAACAMMAALQSAGLAAKDVGYVNLHGTGTRQNDAMEAAAMARVFGAGSGGIIPCSSTKSVTGHTLGAAGAVEAAVCYAVLAMNGGGEDAVLPVQAWDGKWDGKLPRLNIVEKGKEYRKPSVCMTNTFAFGGANVSMVIGRE